MDQNTAQNNSPQFSYPDFSNAQGQNQNQNQQVTSQGAGDDEKIQELRKNLDALIANEDKKQDEVVQEPQETVLPIDVQAQQEIPPSPLPQAPVEEFLDVEEQVNTQSAPQEDIKTEHTYIQEPTPLPGIDSKIEPEEQADVSVQVSPPSGEGFDPLPLNLPKFSETLDNIMPDTTKKKPVKEEIQEELEVKQEPKPSRENDLLIPEQEIQQEEQSSQELTQDSSSEMLNSNLSIHTLLSEAINRNASDLHLGTGYPPILRIDGDLVNIDENILSPEDTEQLIFSVLSDEKKELLEVNREVDFAYTHQGASNARFRINAYYSMRNLSAAFRLIPPRVKTIEELMLPQMYNQFAKLKQGLILVTGPTGHGKSTTIASILEAINRTRFCHIVTIEDPIEYVFEGKKALIDQREMNDDTHSWNIALRSALRQDPDVILVGEMRDFETIASAITLAETGHLVFATLHTNSASQTLDRIIDVFPENQQQQVRTQVANTLEAVVAQRLIPLDKGGRRAVSEIMLNNSAVSNLIREAKSHQIDNVIRTSSDLGMVSLERSLVNLVREGVITVQRAQEYAVHPEEILRLMKV